MEDTQPDNLDVDVEKLISFIKKKAQERMAQELVSGPPDSTGEHTNEPKRPDVPADNVVPAQIDSVFKLQADFNHQLTRSLTLFGDYIQGLQQGLAGIEGRLNDETVRSFLKDQLGNLALIGEDLKAKTEGALVRAADTEQRISRELKSVEQMAQVNFGTLHMKLEKEKGQTADLIRQTSARMQTLSEDILAVR